MTIRSSPNIMYSMNIIVLYDTTSRLVFDGVLYPEVVLVLVLVCTGGGILGTIHLAILRECNGVMADVIQLMYGTYVVVLQSSMLLDN